MWWDTFWRTTLPLQGGGILPCTTQFYNPADHDMILHHCENLKSHTAPIHLYFGPPENLVCVLSLVTICDSANFRAFQQCTMQEIQELPDTWSATLMTELHYPTRIRLFFLFHVMMN